MKQKLHHKKPLQSNLTLSQAIAYIEFYHYLEHYNFGPYYIDDMILPGIKVLCLEHIDTAFNIKGKPALVEHLNKWYPDRHFYPENATHIVWVTYQSNENCANGQIKAVVSEASLYQLLHQNGESLNLQYTMRLEQAEQIYNHFLPLVDKCVLIPGYYLIKAINIINIKQLPEDSPLNEFVKSRKNKHLLAQGDYSVIAKICSDADINGSYTNVKYYFLYDLLNKYQVKLNSRQD